MQTSAKSIRILLVDDHTVVRKGIRMILSAQPDMEVVAEAKNGLEAVAEAERTQPDVVIMDVNMEGLNGIEGTRRIAGISPRSRVLALSMHRDAVYVREMLRAGAKGYLVKDADDDALLDAVRAVARGEAYLSPSVADAVLTDYRKHVTNPMEACVFGRPITHSNGLLYAGLQLRAVLRAGRGLERNFD